ncbi:MAG TPA: ATPase domain-containing protein [Chloroflexia bacterium]|nr:ATPase domain-containing protein [Chloroflexia bacterium]
MLDSAALPGAPPPDPVERLLQRVPTGIAELDTILHGGLFRGGLYLITGAPGTGKTILSNQIAVHHATTGGRVVYASLLSETYTRMFAHLSSLSFFAAAGRDQLVGDALYYINGYSEMQTAGLTGLRAALQGAIRDRHATLLIVDGALNAEAFAASPLALKEFIRGVQQFAEISGCTVLLLASRDSGSSRPPGDVETTVDGILHLRRQRVGARAIRELEVAKLRGSNFVPGGHAIAIGDAGIVVYPRTEALLTAAVDAMRTGAAARERVTLGIAGLDAMLQGGVFSGSTTALLGPPGSGKTLLGLHFLAEGARRGERGLYFGLNEPPSVVVDAGDRVGLDLTREAAAGRIEVVWNLASEMDPDALAQDLLARLRAGSFKRVFLDGLDTLGDIALATERLGPFFAALANGLRVLEVTTLVSVDLDTLFGPTVAIPIAGVSAVVENLIFLRYVELRSELVRLISVLKTRRSGHDLALRTFTIDDAGITIASTFTSAEAVLTGLARPVLGAMAYAPTIDRPAAPADARESDPGSEPPDADTAGSR